MPSISEAILDNCRSTWLKVARVVAFAHRDLGLPDEEGALDSVAQELKKMVKSGTLEAVGDISDWRESEVRLADIQEQRSQIRAAPFMGSQSSG